MKSYLILILSIYFIFSSCRTEIDPKENVQNETTTLKDSVDSKTSFELVRNKGSNNWDIIYKKNSLFDTLHTQISNDSIGIVAVQFDGEGMEEIIISEYSGTILDEYAGYNQTGMFGWKTYELLRINTIWNLDKKIMVCRLIDDAKIIHQSFQEGGLPGLKGGTADTCFYNYHFSISGINQVEVKNLIKSDKDKCKSLKSDYEEGVYTYSNGKLKLI